MQKIINLRDAQVSTATIEIRTLTVSNKQVTLAVFRQLIEDELINHDGNLNGVPWGTVNYHPDKCGDDRPHIHVVWQNGRDLRRAMVYAEPFRGKELRVNEMKDAERMMVRDCLMGRLPNYKFKIDGTPVEISSRESNILDKFLRDFTRHFDRDFSDRQRKAFDEHHQKCTDILKKRGIDEPTFLDFSKANFPSYISSWLSEDKKFYWPEEFADFVNQHIDDVKQTRRQDAQAILASANQIRPRRNATPPALGTAGGQSANPAAAVHRRMKI